MIQTEEGTATMLKRFSISLEENLLEIFDKHIKARSYTNRSEAIRDLIRKAFVKKEWQADKEVMGVISLVYDHHQHKLQDKVTEVQHGYHHHIVSTTHVHMDHDNCLEVIIVRGKAKEIQELSDKLVALRGVRDGHLAMSSTGKFLH
jgi:CopG family nickel-responsive transcriptional regulator